MRGPTGVKFCTMVSTRPNCIMPVQNFGGHTPKKFRGRKTCKIWPDFGGEYLRNGWRYSKSDSHFVYRDFSCVRRNKSGEVWLSDLGNLDVKSYHPIAHFSKKHIWTFRRCCAFKFLHALENHQVLLAHPLTKAGPPLQLFSKENQKLTQNAIKKRL